MSALRNIRERKGFNIPQLASRSGIPGKTLLDYEEGRQSIPLNHAKLLAKALWVQIEDLMPPPSSIMPSPPPLPAQPIARAPQPATPTVGSTSRQVTSAPTPTPVAAQPLAAQTPVVASKPQEATQSDARGPKPEPRAARAPKVTPAITEGQMQELSHLATRLDIAQEQLEERVGKPLTDLTRPEATDWVKRLRAIADEIAPGQRVKYGKWSNGNEDQEATYLAKQREAGAMCVFRLFNGEEFRGTISDFTPYTITIKAEEQGEEVVLRKLAIAYYRCMPTQETGGKGNSSETQPSKPKQAKHNHARDDRHQPVDRGIDSDRVGEPDTPERDRMDKDRGM
jgi:transcriptional regulator with XRE-family HTH domain/sRNA-binding regulator protein Hfq